jgi:hypothetical protein
MSITSAYAMTVQMTSFPFVEEIREYTTTAEVL